MVIILTIESLTRLIMERTHLENVSLEYLLKWICQLSFQPQRTLKFLE